MVMSEFGPGIGSYVDPELYAEYRLVKYCKREHNIALGGKSILIGSPSFYRRADASLGIADPREGVHTTALLPGGPIDLNHRLCRHIFGPGLLLQGRVTVNPEGLIMTRHSLDNCLTFSCTHLPRCAIPTIDIGKRFGPYDSMYEIESPLAFVDRMAFTLFRRARSLVSHEAQGAIPYDHDFFIHTRFGPVSYEGGEQFAITPGVPTLIPSWDARHHLAAIHKSHLLAWQREYRFIWEFRLNNGEQLPLMKDYVIIDVPDGVRVATRAVGM